MAKDIFDNEIEIGDRVVFIRRGYREYSQGVVMTLAPKTAQIKIDLYQDVLYRQEHKQIISLSALVRAGLSPEAFNIERGAEHGNGFNW